MARPNVAGGRGGVTRWHGPAAVAGGRQDAGPPTGPAGGAERSRWDRPTAAGRGRTSHGPTARADDAGTPAGWGRPTDGPAGVSVAINLEDLRH